MGQKWPAIPRFLFCLPNATSQRNDMPVRTLALGGGTRPVYPGWAKCLPFWEFASILSRIWLVVATETLYSVFWCAKKMTSNCVCTVLSFCVACLCVYSVNIFSVYSASVFSVYSASVFSVYSVCLRVSPPCVLFAGTWINCVSIHFVYVCSFNFFRLSFE